jgi:2-polyprenyl-3-methyl-5-hydroxy-6-metoxy-1,4-benzoquinol methylase
MSFDYDSIPVGFYDEVVQKGNPVRRLWHQSKFDRVADCLPRGHGLSVLDIGCFAGTFLSMLPSTRFSRQLGTDILPAQIEYATRVHGRDFREFRHVQGSGTIRELGERFDCVTIIEVIEHLQGPEIREMLSAALAVLKPGGKLVLTTPNYASAWPLIELMLNKLADVTYEEQHLTKFNWFTVVQRLHEIVPELRTEATLDFRASIHFITPFLAAISLSGARKLARLVPHRRWHLPFGNLMMLVFTKS